MGKVYTNIPTKKQALKWSQALRSGKYQQGTKCLEDSYGRYCCLGVGCKLFIPKSKQSTINIISKLTNKPILKGTMPTEQGEAPEWLKEVNNIVENTVGISLVELNDDSDLTFDEIADIIDMIFIYKVIPIGYQPIIRNYEN